MAVHDRNHRCLIEKNVPIVFILPSRWQDGAESLGLEHTSCFDIISQLFDSWADPVVHLLTKLITNKRKVIF